VSIKVYEPSIYGKIMPFSQKKHSLQ